MNEIVKKDWLNLDWDKFEFVSNTEEVEDISRQQIKHVYVLKHKETGLFYAYSETTFGEYEEGLGYYQASAKKTFERLASNTYRATEEANFEKSISEGSIKEVTQKTKTVFYYEQT